ncbi:vitamin B12 ABC transporter permease BtuC, partial [Escherichia coli]
MRVSWVMGRFCRVDGRESWLMLALIPVLLWICCQSRPMNMLALGEISARQLGLPLWVWRNVLVAETGWQGCVSFAVGVGSGCMWFCVPPFFPLGVFVHLRFFLPR